MIGGPKGAVYRSVRQIIIDRFLEFIAWEGIKMGLTYMSETRRPVNSHKAYHAHVYFEQGTLELASGLCEKAGELFGLRVGSVHQKPVGPHPKWSCQITFAAKHFDAFIPWIDQNRNGLTILVHGLTGDDLKDHTEYAYWLGDSVELKLSIFNT